MTSMADLLTKAARAQGAGAQKPLPVEIVRPNSGSWETSVGKLLAALAVLAFSGWVVMALLPAFTPWHLGYWQAVAAVITVRALTHSDQYVEWTRAQRKSERSK